MSEHHQLLRGVLRCARAVGFVTDPRCDRCDLTVRVACHSKLVAEAHEMKSKLAEAEAALDALKLELENEASKIPNATSPQVSAAAALLL